MSAWLIPQCGWASSALSRTMTIGVYSSPETGRPVVELTPETTGWFLYSFRTGISVFCFSWIWNCDPSAVADRQVRAIRNDKHRHSILLINDLLTGCCGVNILFREHIPFRNKRMDQKDRSEFYILICGQEACMTKRLAEGECRWIC